MTLSEIARRIEEIRAGTLPRLLSVGTESLWTNCADSPKFVARLPDDIARHMLIGAMVMAMGAKRLNFDPLWERPGWAAPKSVVGGCVSAVEFDSDHGNDPLRSLLAAFERVYAKEDK